MPYPESYEPAEHRRALAVLLSDLLDEAQRGADRDRTETANGAPTPVLRASEAAGDCAVVVSLGPPVRPSRVSRLA